RQIAKDALLAAQRILPSQALALLTFQKRAVVQFGLRVHAPVARLVTRPPPVGRFAIDLFEAHPLARQILRLSPQLSEPLLVSRAHQPLPLRELVVEDGRLA